VDFKDGFEKKGRFRQIFIRINLNGLKKYLPALNHARRLNKLMAGRNSKEVADGFD
jgi:hypothetical protein